MAPSIPESDRPENASTTEGRSLSPSRVWKYFGSLFMEEKNGTQAMSLTRFLAFLLFWFCVWNWQTSGAVPHSMLYTLWALLGLKGVNKVAESVVARK